MVPGVDSDICKRFFTHDPQQYDFSDKHLPSLYLFRERSARAPEFTTEDLQASVDRVRCFWILPPAGQFNQPARARAIAKVGALIKRALTRGRDPSYIIAGDPDPQAPLEGSVVIRHAGLIALVADDWQRTNLAIAPLGNMRTERVDVGMYEALQIELLFTQHDTDKPGQAVPAVVGPTLENTFPAGVRATVSVDGVTSGEYRDPLDLLEP